MTGKFNIDGADAYKQFGVFISDSGLVGLLQYPPLKKVDSNDWPDEDGEEFDLSCPALDTKTVSVKFASHKANRFDAFIAAMSDAGYHELEVPSIHRTFKLRISGQQAMSHYPRAEEFTLQLSDDFPLNGYSYLAPEVSKIRTSGFELDGVDLGKYGVAILEGSLSDILKSPAVKQNLLQSQQRKNGVVYDVGNVVFQTKDVKLKCALTASTFVEFWRNYDALLYNLTRPGERLLFVEYTGFEYQCYYKNCTSSRFLFTNGKIWWVFDLTLVFTSFRNEGELCFLASESDEWIMTEHGDFAIDLTDTKE